MTITQVSAYQEQLSRVADCFPSVREYLARCTDGLNGANRTLDLWGAMLAGCEIEDVRSVVDSIVQGRMQPWSQFQKPDTLPANIRRAAQQRVFERSERQRTSQLQEKRTFYEKPDTSRFGKCKSVALRLGQMVRDRKISREENRLRMEIVIAWFEGRAVEPDWDALTSVEY